MASQLERRIAQFTDWRTKLVTATDEFRAWQDTYGHADIEQTLRIYDLVEGLRNDRIRLAFLGESAEDKIGLIKGQSMGSPPTFWNKFPISEGTRDPNWTTVMVYRESTWDRLLEMFRGRTTPRIPEL